MSAGHSPLETPEGLAERCETLRASLQHRAPDLAAQLLPYWPGGDENPETVGLAPWIVCYAQVIRLLGEDHHRRGSAQPHTDAILLAALSAAPAYVEQGAPLAPLAVFPKGFRALLHLHARSARIAWLMERSAALTASASAEDLPLLERVQAELAYQHAVCAWVATHEGPGLPFSDRESRPTPPDVMANLDPQVLRAVLSAFMEVNWLRLNALDAMQRPSGSGEARPTWSAFFGALAIEHDEKPETLMRDYSLAALLASTTLSAQQRQQAMDEAERRAAQRPRR